MLYPKENREERVLYFACRNCDHQEEASSHCVYRNNIMSQAIDQTQIIPGLPSDPTLPRTKNRTCPKCSNNEAVFFQSHDRRRETPMTLYFVCARDNCGHLWTDEHIIK